MNVNRESEMVAFWTNIAGDEAQPRHNVHLLDAGVVVRLFATEVGVNRFLRNFQKQAAENALENKDNLLLRQNSKDAIAAFAAKQHSLLFEALSLFTRDANALVIPESVFREIFQGQPVPIYTGESGKLEWAYSSFEHVARVASEYKMSPRARQFTNFLMHNVHEDKLHICDSPEEFGDYCSSFHPGINLIIVRDQKTKGDQALRELAENINPTKVGAISVLSNDSELKQSMGSILQDYITADALTILNSFIMLNHHRKRSAESTPELFREVVELAARRDPEGGENDYKYTWSQLRSQRLLEALGHSLDKSNNLGR